MKLSIEIYNWIKDNSKFAVNSYKWNIPRLFHMVCIGNCMLDPRLDSICPYWIHGWFTWKQFVFLSSIHIWDPASLFSSLDTWIYHYNCTLRLCWHSSNVGVHRSTIINISRIVTVILILAIWILLSIRFSIRYPVGIFLILTDYQSSFFSI